MSDLNFRHSLKTAIPLFSFLFKFAQILNDTRPTFGFSCHTSVTAMQDQPVVQVEHKFFFIWCVFNDALLGFFNGLALGITSAVCNALDMGIDGDKVSTFVIF